MMNTQQVFSKCIGDFFIETLLNCPDTCITENENELTIALPEDELTQELAERIRAHVYDLLESPEFIQKLSEKLSEAKEKKLEGYVAKDLDGFVIHFENKNGA